MACEQVGLVVSNPEQVILEADPYRLLAYTWHTFTPEWAAQHGFDAATVAIWGAEPHSRVAFDMEDTSNGIAKLTAVHDRFESGSEVLTGATHGWPAVIASLKTLLETGSALTGRLSCGLPPPDQAAPQPGRARPGPP